VFLLQVLMKRVVQFSLIALALNWPAWGQQIQQRQTDRARSPNNLA